MINAKLIKKYYDKRSACQVLGILMHEPFRIKDKEYVLNEKDFSSGLHQIIFICIYNLAYQDIKKITISEIESYLANTSPLNYKKVFEDSKGTEWINDILEDANIINYTYYYQKYENVFIKMLFRTRNRYFRYLNIDEIDPILKQEQQDKFDKMLLKIL